MTKRLKLDRTDLKILEKLQEDGRITNVELAKHAGISAPPCLRRVRALEESGVLRGYYADVKPAALGYDIVTFIQVKLDSQKEADLNEFEQTMTTWPNVRECYLLSGDVDYLLKVVAKDWDDLQNFLTQKLTRLSHVTSVKTAPLIRTAQKLPGVPINS